LTLWRLISFHALPDGIEYEVQAPDGSLKRLHLTSGELAALGHAKSPLYDGRPRKLQEGEATV
jgi:hypothetical protein